MSVWYSPELDDITIGHVKYALMDDEYGSYDVYTIIYLRINSGFRAIRYYYIGEFD